MAEENPRETALDNIDFIFRRPWLIICSFLLIFNAIQAYSSTIPAVYNAQAVLLFESALGTSAKKDVINEKKETAEKILTGSNIDPILEEVIKNKPEVERKATYEHLRSKLMNSKTGLRFSWEEKGIGNILNIYFEYGNASDCYKTVKAAMDMIIKESEQGFTREMEANLLFLNNQLKFYKDRLSEIESESEDIRQGLLSRYSELTPKEREVVLKFSDGADLSKTDESQDATAAGDGVIKLRKDLADFKERRKKLQTSLDDGTFMAQSIIADIDEGDLFLKEYKKMVASKEMEIDSLLSRGYKEEHPQVKQLREEVNRAKEMRKKRMERLAPTETANSDYDEARQRVNLEIKELDMKMALIVDNLKNVDANSPAASRQDAKALNRKGAIKEQVLKLSNLANEKTVNEAYHQDMRKNLANAELKYRTESEAAGFKISIVQEPVLPVKPDSSKARGAALRGFMTALLISLGIGYVSYRLKNAIHSDHELEDLLGIPVIATIDNITTRKDMIAKNSRFKYTAIAIITVIIITRVAVAFIYSTNAL